MRISMNQPLPIPTMYGILFTYMWLIFVVNVGEHTWMVWVLMECKKGFVTVVFNWLPDSIFRSKKHASAVGKCPSHNRHFNGNIKTQQQLVTGKDQCLERPVVYSPPLKSQQLITSHGGRFHCWFLWVDTHYDFGRSVSKYVDSYFASKVGPSSQCLVVE